MARRRKAYDYDYMIKMPKYNKLINAIVMKLPAVLQIIFIARVVQVVQEENRKILLSEETSNLSEGREDQLPGHI